MDTLLRKFGDSFLDDHANGQNYSSKTDEIFSEWMTSKMASIMDDNNRKEATVNEVYTYLNGLYESCTSEEEERNFLYTLAEFTDIEDTKATTLKECAEKIVEMKDDEAESVFDTLEEAVPGWKETGKSAEKKVAVNKDGKRGAVIRKGQSSNDKDKSGNDIVVVPLKGANPLYRRQTMWRAGDYTMTDDTVKLDLNKVNPQPRKEPSDEDED